MDKNPVKEYFPKKLFLFDKPYSDIYWQHWMETFISPVISLMPKTITLLTTLFLLTSFISVDTPTDLKEYNFKGKVKSVTTLNYTGLEQKNGVWEIGDKKEISKWVMHFNQEGNISKIKEYYPVVGNAWNELTSTIEFINGRKSKLTKTDQMGIILEEGEYTWLNNYNYNLVTTKNNGMVMTSHSKLNLDFRDYSGGYTYTEDDNVVLSQSYVNQLMPDGEIISSTYTDNITGNGYVVEYANKKKDENGNFIRVASVVQHDQTLKKLSVRSFEYYE